MDGLDEVAESAERTLMFAKEYADRNPGARITVSSRDTVEGLTWDGAMIVRVHPFTIEQQHQFIDKWFTSQPEAATRLTTWLEMQDDMRNAARTPLILALLCSLSETGSALPKTEIELYQGRFDLMLGRWEKAKGLAPLPTDVRDHYEHFLAAFAMNLHQDEQRTGPQESAVQIANRFRYRVAHGTGENLVYDCIKRGILQREPNKHVSFGDHLTYQEFMAAEWLRMYNRVDFVWDRLTDPWWAKALEFYAGMTRDLRSLIREAVQYRYDERTFRRLHELHAFAPLTSRQSLDRLMGDRDTLPPYMRGGTKLRIDVLE